MPPRTGQLDEISQAIGELRAYVHEHRHGVNNVSQKIDALGVRIGKDIATTEARIEAKFDAFMKTTDARLTALELTIARETGAKNLAAWFVQSPFFAWLAALAALAIAWWRKS